MFPPSKFDEVVALSSVVAVNGPVFIQVGGVQGLAQNLMSGFTASAALM